MNRNTFLICTSPVGAHWRLGLPSKEDMVLIGWNKSDGEMDGGMPKDVANVLARAMASVALVSFPVGARALDAGNGNAALRNEVAQSLVTHGLRERVEAVVKGEHSHIPLVSTRHPETVWRLFEDATYSWQLQGQIVLLSALGSQPPKLDRKTLLSLFAKGWTNHAASLAGKGVLGVLRPGVDGDVAGFLSLSDEFKQTFFSAVEREARSAKFDWRLVPEDIFVDALAGDA